MAVIRISGYHGSGKTTLSERLAKALGYEYHYTGGVFRKLAKECGLSIEDFYARVISDPELERKIDGEQEKLMMERDNLVVEALIAPFLKCSFPAINVKIFVEPEEGVRRQLMRPENAGKSFGEMAEKSRARLENEKIHYLSLYGIRDHLADDIFAVIVDTTKLNPDEAFKAVMEKLKPLLKN